MEQNQTQGEPKKQNNRLTILMIILALLIVGVGVYLIYNEVLRDDTNKDGKKGNANLITIGTYYITENAPDENSDTGEVWEDNYTELILKNNNEFEYYINECEGTSNYTGTYSIKNNQLILKLDVSSTDPTGPNQIAFAIINNQKLKSLESIGCTFKNAIYELGGGNSNADNFAYNDLIGVYKNRANNNGECFYKYELTLNLDRTFYFATGESCGSGNDYKGTYTLENNLLQFNITHFGSCDITAADFNDCAMTGVYDANTLNSVEILSANILDYNGNNLLKD